MNILDEIRDAVLDLQRSDHPGFARPLKILARLLDDPSLEIANTRLVGDQDLDAFLEKSRETEGSMVGSAYLDWPEERERQLGLTVLLLKRFGTNPDEIVDFGHTFFYAGNNYAANVHSVVRQVVIPFERDYRKYIMSPEGREMTLPRQQSNRIFVVHGRDDGARESVARFLERLGLEAVILHEQASRGRTVIEKIEHARDIAFAVVLLSPDDEGRRMGEQDLRPRARQNVLLELGYFIGKLGRDRVCALRKGNVEIPSDYEGVVWTEFDRPGAWKMKLAQELKAAEFDVDLNRV